MADRNSEALPPPLPPPFYLPNDGNGGVCAAEESNSRSDRIGDKSWSYLSDNGDWKEGMINVKCLTHT